MFPVAGARNKKIAAGGGAIKNEQEIDKKKNRLVIAT